MFRDFGGGLAHAFGNAVGHLGDVLLLVDELLSPFLTESRLLGGCVGLLGNASLGRGGSFERLGGAGQLARFHSQLTPLGIGKLRFDFGECSLQRLGCRFGRTLARVGCFGCRLLERLGRFVGRFLRIGEARGNGARHVGVLGGAFEFLGYLLLVLRRLGGILARLGGGSLLLVGGVLQLLLQLAKLLDLFGQLGGAFIGAVEVNRLLEDLLDLGQAAEHLALFESGLVLLLLEQLGGCLVGRRLGLLSQGLGGGETGQRLRQPAQVLVKLRLLLDQLFGALAGQLLAAGLVAHLLLSGHQLANHAQRGLAIGVDQSGQFVDLLQQGAEPLDDGLLILGSLGKGGGLQVGTGGVELRGDLAGLENAQAIGCPGAHVAPPRAHVGKRLHQHEEQRLYVALILNRHQGGAFARVVGLLGKQRGSAVRLFLQGDKLTHLRRQSSDLQPPLQLLPLGHEHDDHLANGAAGIVEFGRALFGGALLRFGQQPHDVLHLLVDQGVDVLAHLQDLAVDRFAVEPVFLELAKLDVERRRDQLACHGAGFFLGLLLLPYAVDFGGGGGCGRQGTPAKRCDERESEGPFHGVSPMPSSSLLMSVRRCSVRSSASRMAAYTPLGSETSSTKGSLRNVAPGRSPR